MPIGTASHRLRKSVMFALLKELNKNFCFRCGAEIQNVDELSIDHKQDWLNSDDPLGNFFNIDNIAFSHLKCNCDSGRSNKTGVKHPSHRAYNEGCRCDECKKVEAEKKRKQRAKKKNSTGGTKRTCSLVG